MRLRRAASLILEWALLVYVAAFFLTLGSDFPTQVEAKLWVGRGLLIGLLIFAGREFREAVRETKTSLFFLALVGFELLRSVFVPSDSWALLEIWLLRFGYFLAGLALFRGRSSTDRLSWTLGWSGFFLALNAIPAFLIRGHAGYPVGEKEFAFFYPPLYSNEILAQYLFGTFAHVNYTGDVIALGFFPALGLFFHGLHRWHPREKFVEMSRAVIPSAVISAIFFMTTALAVIGFRSRGTVLCFSVSVLLYLAMVLFRFPSRRQWVAGLSALLLIFGFLIWAGDPKGMWSELQTVSRESEEGGSFDATREGARRAVRIFGAHPLWGVGTGRYSEVSTEYATPGMAVGEMPDFKVMCHYLQVLAEEGVGAFLYFMVLLTYFWEAIRGLLRCRSRFQYLAGGATFMAVVMVLGHAFFNHLLERFSISMLIYVLMGATLGILSREFKQAHGSS